MSSHEAGESDMALSNLLFMLSFLCIGCLMLTHVNGKMKISIKQFVLFFLSYFLVVIILNFMVSFDQHEKNNNTATLK